MAETHKRLAGPAQLTGAAATQYTVPATTKTIIRHIHISNTGAGAVTLTMSVGTDAAGTRLFDAYSIAAGATLDWFPFLVLTAAEIIQAFAGTANVLVITISGTEYTL